MSAAVGRPSVRRLRAHWRCLGRPFQAGVLRSLFSDRAQPRGTVPTPSGYDIGRMIRAMSMVSSFSASVRREFTIEGRVHASRILCRSSSVPYVGGRDRGAGVGEPDRYKHHPPRPPRVSHCRRHSHHVRDKGRATRTTAGRPLRRSVGGQTAQQRAR